jgi:hypothetical protein
MKLLKITDLSLQLFITTAGLLYLFMEADGCGILYLYYLLGGWQVASFFAHLFISQSWKSRSHRNLYGKTLLWIAFIGLINYLLLLIEVPLVLFYLAGILVISPALAIWYFMIGIQEWKSLKNRELIHLK